MKLSENTFIHDDLLYDLTKVRISTQSEKAFLLPINELLWILKHDIPREDRVLKAKLRYPLLVTRWHGKWVVVDGLHRLERYRRRGITVIPVKRVTTEMLERALIVHDTHKP